MESQAAGPLITDVEKGDLTRRTKRSSESLPYEKQGGNEPGPAAEVKFDSEEEEETSIFYRRFRPYILGGVAATILGWWISATVLPATRHRWCVPHVLTRQR
jgi:CNT family concentrative nucleoside transporter